MREQDVHKAFEETPALFHERVQDTLQSLTEEPKVKKITLRTALIAALITLLALGTAYAVVTNYGLDFWNVERGCGADMDKVSKLLNAECPVECGECTNQLVNITVNQSAWLSDEIFQVTLSAALRDAETYELHPMQNLDADGAVCLLSEPLPQGDDEARYESFLWTEKGFGLPKDTMDDPTKRLLLFSEGDGAGDAVITVGTADGVALTPSMMDVLRAKDGTVQMIVEMNLTSANPELSTQSYPSWDEMGDKYRKNWQNSRSDYEAYLQNVQDAAKAQQDAIAQYTDANGYLTLVLHAYATEFTADENGVSTFDYVHPDDPGTTTFRIKIVKESLI